MVRVGVIGIGNMGSAHAKHIAGGNVDGMILSAVCDLDESKLKEFKASYPDVLTYTDYKDLINSGEVDAVIIATPHYFHSPIGIDALEQGLHILTEKPVGVYVRQAKRLMSAADKAGKVFAIMFNQRTDPIFQKARELVKNGDLGELKRINWVVTNWYRTQHYYDSGSWRATWSGEGGGVLINQAPHNLDILTWICGMPKKVQGFMKVAKYHDIDVEDEATIFAEYENGATCVFIASTGELPGTNRLEIAGTMGKIVIEAGKLTFSKLKVSEREICFSSEESFPKAEYDVEEFSFDEQISGHATVLQNFADAIEKGTPLIADGRDGINELSLSNAAYLSSYKGKAVSLPLADDEIEDFLHEKIKDEKPREKKEAKEKPSEGYSTRWSVRW